MLFRSPGAYVMEPKDREKQVFIANLMPARGSWLELEIDKKGRVYVRIDRKRKLPITVLLRAMGYVEDVVEPRERAARTGSINGSQDGDSSWTGERATGGGTQVGLPRGRRAQKARPAKIAQGQADPCEGLSALTDPVRPGLRMWRRGRCGRLRLSADCEQCTGGSNVTSRT